MVRIQVEMSEEQVAELDALMQRMKIRTRKDLFNNAVTLIEWAVNEKAAGSRIAAINTEKRVIRELVMPALEKIPLQPSAPGNEPRSMAALAFGSTTED